MLFVVIVWTDSHIYLYVFPEMFSVSCHLEKANFPHALIRLYECFDQNASSVITSIFIREFDILRRLKYINEIGQPMDGMHGLKST